ncbi:glycosyltransferase family 2 protein [Streptomyces fulvoviolaceus]|uniref:glycosyltransferase family 2 protein n=1 Tax=Streptomyces fulvoviolaceus TaxID=285535 RepID=UPI0021C0872C|nr:glycosyltransferase [Streptomyces fulvoviolaceus]MCT9078352.1 glycosyltransferase [Streptomyces fulvoviolaceus]
MSAAYMGRKDPGAGAVSAPQRLGSHGSGPGQSVLTRPKPAPPPLPPLRSARPQRPGAVRRWLDRMDPDTRYDARRVLTLICLLPLLLILARGAPALLEDPLLMSYGFTVLLGTITMFYLAYTRYDDPSERPMRKRPKARDLESFPALPTTPRVSFLLAVKDEVENIESCVRSMATSDYPDLQVVVVDDLSEDGTQDVLRRLEAELGITVIYLKKNLGKKGALVRACEVAHGDIIAMTDSDCFLAPDALGRCVRALVDHPELGAVSGHARALNAGFSFWTKAQDVWFEGQFRVAKATESTFGRVTCVSGPLAVFRRDAIFNYLPAWANDRFMGAPFRFSTDRQLTGYVLGQKWKGQELKRKYADSPFVTRRDYPEREWRVGYVYSAKVWTNAPPRFRPLMKQQIRWKKSFVRNLCFTGTFMWRMGLGPATLYYGHVLWVTAAPFMAFRHMIWAPAQGAAFLTLLYLCGIILKGCAYGLAFKIDNPGDARWIYRPAMGLLSTLLLAWLLPYSLATIRRGVWSRSAT